MRGLNGTQPLPMVDQLGKVIIPYEYQTSSIPHSYHTTPLPCIVIHQITLRACSTYAVRTCTASIRANGLQHPLLVHYPTHAVGHWPGNTQATLKDLDMFHSFSFKRIVYAALHACCHEVALIRSRTCMPYTFYIDSM